MYTLILTSNHVDQHQKRDSFLQDRNSCASSLSQPRHGISGNQQQVSYKRGIKQTDYEQPGRSS